MEIRTDLIDSKRFNRDSKICQDSRGFEGIESQTKLDSYRGGPLVVKLMPPTSSGDGNGDYIAEHRKCAGRYNRVGR